jgi:hypothetical protein
MRALVKAVLVTLAWIASTGSSSSQSGGVIQFGPFQIPIFGAAPAPGPIPFTPNFGQTSKAPRRMHTRNQPAAGSFPAGSGRTAAPRESLDTVIGGSRIKF